MNVFHSIVELSERVCVMRQEKKSSKPPSNVGNFETFRFACYSLTRARFNNIEIKVKYFYVFSISIPSVSEDSQIVITWSFPWIIFHFVSMCIALKIQNHYGDWWCVCVCVWAGIGTSFIWTLDVIHYNNFLWIFFT